VKAAGGWLQVVFEAVSQLVAVSGGWWLPSLPF